MGSPGLQWPRWRLVGAQQRGHDGARSGTGRARGDAGCPHGLNTGLLSDSGWPEQRCARGGAMEDSHDLTEARLEGAAGGEERR